MPISTSKTSNLVRRENIRNRLAATTERLDYKRTSHQVRTVARTILILPMPVTFLLYTHNHRN
jgi:ribosomal protein S19